MQFEQVRLHCIRFLRIFAIARKGQVGLRLYGAVLSPLHPGLRPGCRIYNSNNLPAVVPLPNKILDRKEYALFCREVALLEGDAVHCLV